MLLPVIYFLPHTQFTQAKLLNVIVVAIIMTTAVLCFFKTLEKGNAAVNGTIAASFSFITVLISIFFFNEKPNPLQLVAILIVISGVIITSFDFRNFNAIHLREKNIIYAFIAMILWGIHYAVVKIPSRELGWFWPAFFARVAVIIYLPYFLQKKISFEKVKGFKSFGILIATAILPTLGDFTYSAGVIISNTSLFAPVAASSPIIFVLLASWWFKDKISKIQKIGITLTLAGIILLGL